MQGGIEDGQIQSSSKDPVEGAAALDLLQGISELLIARGRKTLCFDLKGARPNDDELLELLLGRSGKLRDPAMRVGGKFLVGEL